MDSFFEVLLNEYGVKGQRRNQLIKSVSKTGALPTTIPKVTPVKPLVKKTSPTSITQVPKLKTLSQIVDSDAYSIPQYVPKVFKSRDLEKKKLFAAMSGQEYTDEQLSTKKSTKRASEYIEPGDEFAELLAEIQERQEWLQDMMEMGAGQTYRTRITTEIQQRIRRLEQIDSERSRSK